MINKLNIQQLPESGRELITLAFKDWDALLTQKQLTFPQHPDFLASAAQVWYCSEFVRQYCLKKPECLLQLIDSGDLFSSTRREQYEKDLQVSAVEDEALLMKQLRDFRNREMVRIAWRDLAGWSDLNETLYDLTALAETCIQQALDNLYQKACSRRGTPRLADGRPLNLVVLGMGKLGAWELNYSSDIDLIFAFEEEGVLEDRKQTSYGEFFTRLARSLVKVLDEMTMDGFVFRTDTRLRPFGDSGPLVMSFAGMENYYLTQAREWERYAMIKARQVAGDEISGQKLFEIIRPFVYRRYLDYGAFEELRSLKTQINRELRRKDRLDNIKLGPGGIREIEFIGQAFQLIRGGQETRLQQREIQKILPLLAELGLLDAAESDCLLSAYRYLRRVENHIQEYQDKQTHDLPTQAEQQTVLAFSMGFAQWDLFKQELDQTRQAVQQLFDLIFTFSRDEKHEPDNETLWPLPEQQQVANQRLSQLGYQEPEGVRKLLQDFSQAAVIQRLSTKAMTTLEHLMPEVIKKAAITEQADVTLKRLLDLFERIAGRNIYFSLLQENPEALQQLVKLVAASSWIAEYLAQYPVLLDELLDPRTLYEPLDKQGLAKELAAVVNKIPADDEEQLMIALRQFKHQNVLRVAAADISGVIPVMIVSDYLTWIAEVVLDKVVDAAWELLRLKHGLPAETAQGEGFAIVGMGKLGGFELGYGSDLDMVFLYDCTDSQAMTTGPKTINNTQFYMRLGQKIRHILDARMLSGILYETDLRLRPSGDSGLLVTQIDHYRQYQLENAWTWEHQALVRGRFIVGDSVLAQRFADIRREVLTKPRDINDLRVQVREMRQKMRDNLAPKQTDIFHLKQSKGGIADIEFIVQFGVLAFASENPELLRWTDTVRLLDTLAQHGFLKADEAEMLKTAYCQYRDDGHHLVLQGKDLKVPVGRYRKLADAVSTIWDRTLGDT
jgi:glutamate-ammonia-ligase adenylyltransferase